MIGDNDQTLLFNAKDVETTELLLKAGAIQIIWMNLGSPAGFVMREMTHKQSGR